MQPSLENFPVGIEIDVAYPSFKVSLKLLSVTQLEFHIKEGPFARTEVVDTHVIPLGNSLFAVSWQERDGATVTNVQDYDRGLIHSHATLSDGQFMRMTGTFEVTRPADIKNDDTPEYNKAIVREAMISLFQRRDASAVERFYAPNYVQHNPNIAQGRDALRQLVSNLSEAVYYEPGLIVAEGSLVALHGRIRGWAEEPQVVVDLFRIENGMLAEHWDVLQDEVPISKAMGAVSMFDPDEGARLA